MLELGALLGALGAGFYANRFSRGKSIVIACSKRSSFHSHFCCTQSFPSCLLYRVYIPMRSDYPWALVYWSHPGRDWNWRLKVRLPGIRFTSRLMIENS